MQELRRLFTAEQVAEILQLERGQIEWLISTGQLQAISICNTVRFDSKDLAQLIETYRSVTARRREK